jgi:hypothetical protein
LTTAANSATDLRLSQCDGSGAGFQLSPKELAEYTLVMGMRDRKFQTFSAIKQINLPT